MSAKAMTSRERWRALFARQKPDRVPTDYWATPEFDRKLRARLGCRTRREMLDKLGVDYEVWLKPEYVGPRLARMQDEFGRRFRSVDYGTGSGFVMRATISQLRRASAPGPEETCDTPAGLNLFALRMGRSGCDAREALDTAAPLWYLLHVPGGTLPQVDCSPITSAPPWVRLGRVVVPDAQGATPVLELDPGGVSSGPRTTVGA